MAKDSVPASEAQLSYLKRLGATAPVGITKKEAIDLIGSYLKPSRAETELLKFFGVTSSAMNQTEARRCIEEIFSDPANEAKWENRPASKEQLEILAFFRQPTRPKPTFSAAEKTIKDIFEDDQKAAAWEAEEEMIDRLASLHDYANEIAGLSGMRKLSKKLFQQTFECLSAEGHTIEQLEADDDCLRILSRAAEIDPSVIKDTVDFQIYVLKK